MKTYNFCAGPAMLPEPVLAQAQRELINWNNTGCSVMEVSHRSKQFIDVAETAERDLRDLLNIPANYSVLFMHGGGRAQFSAVPLNLAQPDKKSLHIISGSWSKGAYEESKKYNQAEVIADLRLCDLDQTFTPIKYEDDTAKYCHFCPNETVEGIAIDWLPDVGNVPVVADMSSTILSRPLDIDNYGLIYAGAQKNIGPSGLGIVIVRNDLLRDAQTNTPSIYNYQLQAKHQSMYNTPPTFAWYLAGLVFRWLKNIGGLSEVERLNKQKAQSLYSAIDSSDLYVNNIHADHRSKMNVIFNLKDPSLEKEFVEKASIEGLLALAGHRSVGGIRASIYNAMPIEGVNALVQFMRHFEQKHS